VCVCIYIYIYIYICVFLMSVTLYMHVYLYIYIYIYIFLVLITALLLGVLKCRTVGLVPPRWQGTAPEQHTPPGRTPKGAYPAAVIPTRQLTLISRAKRAQAPHRQFPNIAAWYTFVKLPSVRCSLLSPIWDASNCWPTSAW